MRTNGVSHAGLSSIAMSQPVAISIQTGAGTAASAGMPKDMAARADQIMKNGRNINISDAREMRASIKGKQ